MWGINTIQPHTVERYSKALQEEAKPEPQRVIIPPEERVQKRARSPDSPLGGKNLKPHLLGNAPLPPINKEDFQIWKPWLEEVEVPKWAEKIQNGTLNQMLGSPTLPTKEVELPVDWYNEFACKDIIKENMDAVKTHYHQGYMQNDSNVEDSSRLNQIFRNFAQKMNDFDSEMQPYFNLKQGDIDKDVRESAAETAWREN